MSLVKPWKVLSSQSLNHYKIFETRRDRVLSPRTGKEHDAYIVAGASWVNVLALTEDRKILLVQQYRHGIQQVIWEIPGGVIHDNESPETAAARELLEETGWTGETPFILGKVHPNPAFQTNSCYTVLIQNIRFKQKPQMDEMEDIAVKLVPEEDFSKMVISGEISHALIIVADYWRRLWRSGMISSSVV